jgi:pimeloyl-ACP methyl ester carboxylesterase
MAADRQQAGAGATISQVALGGTAEAIGVRTGDVVIRAGESPVAGPGDLVAYAARLTGGSPVRLIVRRGGVERVLSGPARERPREAYPGGIVDYGAVPFGGGQLRDILVMPQGVSAPPVVFLLQGYSCATIEIDTYRRLAEALLHEGIGFYRVEKPGVGDSAGGAQCMTIDYATELDAFRAAYRSLTDVRGVPAERVFMLGHSLGGLQAPMLAAERPPRGLAVYGTVLRNWADYHRDVGQFQPYLFYGADLAEQTARSDRWREAIRRFYMEREAPAAIAAADPAMGEALRQGVSWDGGANVLGRSYVFAQDLAHLPLIAAWRDARTNVLAMYGEADLVALNDVDHRLIADLANHYRPGSGRFVQIARTGHGMDVIGTPLEVRAATRAANGAPPQGPFNPEIARVLAEWIREAMARAPVA